jgi:hypothetical protein
MLNWAWKRAGTRDRDGQVHIMLKRWALLGRSQNVFSKSPTLSYLHGALRWGMRHFRIVGLGTGLWIRIRIRIHRIRMFLDLLDLDLGPSIIKQD